VQNLQQYVEATKAQWEYQDNQRAAQVQEQAQRQNLERGVSDLTKGMLGLEDGLTPKQYREMRETGKVTIKGRTKRDSEAIDAHSRKATRALDPNGKGWTRAEWEALMDDLADTPPERLDAKIERTGLKADAKAIRKAVDKWRVDRIPIEMQRRSEAAQPEEDETIQLTDDQQRRADLLGAYVDDVPKARNYEQATGAISQDYLEDDTARGDVARAWAAHEEHADASD